MSRRSPGRPPSSSKPAARRPRGRRKAGFPPNVGTLFAGIHPGFEEVLAEELRALGLRPRRLDGGCEVPASPAALDALVHGSWVAGRARVQVGGAQAVNLATLADSVRKLPWRAFLVPRQPVEVEVVSTGSRLRRKDAVARKVEHAIADALRGPREVTGPPPRRPGLVHVRIVGDRAQLSLDAVGDRLHRRGWRKATGGAPVRENLASAVLRLAGWTPGETLVDPFCGSGTFGIEAARWATGRTPRLDRDGAWSDWPCLRGHRPAIPSGPGSVLAGIHVSDRADGALRATEANARRGQVLDRLRLGQVAFEDLQPPGPSGLLVANPPYGRRLGAEAGRGAWNRWGQVLQDRWGGWRVAVLAPDPDAVQRLGSGLRVATTFRHGGQPVVVAVGTLGG